MRTAFALLLATFVASAPPGFAAPPENEPFKKEGAKEAGKPVVVPFELLKSRHMAIRVKINGKGPYRVIFDTGAPTNLVNNKVAKEAGLVGKKEPTGFFGASLGAKTIKAFEVGGLVLKDMPTMVMDHPTVAAIADVVGPVEGLIGYPFFARYKMTIDYQKKEMTLTPSGFEPTDTMQAMMEKLMGAAGGKKQEPTVLAPAAVWGFSVDKEKGDEAEGVRVTEVLAKSPAAAGGLKAGDRLLTLDGRWTDSVADTYLAATGAKPGKPVALVVKRDGQDVKLTVTPGKGL